MPVVKTLFYGSRLLPRVAFSLFWSKAFEWLQSQGEDDLVASYQRNYFELSPDNQWTSDWAGSMDNCAAGFYVGSQPQERWRKSRLRVALGDMRWSRTSTRVMVGRADRGMVEIPCGCWQLCVEKHKLVCKTRECLVHERSSMRRLCPNASVKLEPELEGRFVLLNLYVGCCNCCIVYQVRA